MDPSRLSIWFPREKCGNEERNGVWQKMSFPISTQVAPKKEVHCGLKNVQMAQWKCARVLFKRMDAFDVS